MPEATSPLVGIVMGSDSDWPKIRAAAAALEEFGVAFEVRVMSAIARPSWSGSTPPWPPRAG